MTTAAVKDATGIRQNLGGSCPSSKTTHFTSCFQPERKPYSQQRRQNCWASAGCFRTLQAVSTERSSLTLLRHSRFCTKSLNEYIYFLFFLHFHQFHLSEDDDTAADTTHNELAPTKTSTTTSRRIDRRLVEAHTVRNYLSSPSACSPVRYSVLLELVHLKPS